MNPHEHLPGRMGSEPLQLLLIAVLFASAMALYLLAAYRVRAIKAVPVYRLLGWISGVLSVLAAVVGPLANRAHTDFAAHMLVHLLIGMLAPLLLALAAPMTLLLRIAPVRQSRRISRLLRSAPFRVLHNPVTAALLNIGGLYLLYTTDLYRIMQENGIVHASVHVHFLFAGYLFTTSIIYIDPMPHRTRYVYRMTVLLLAMAAHGILSKYMYANPPAGVPAGQAETGSMLMYYGGDLADIVLVSVLLYQWYNARRSQAGLLTVRERFQQ